MQTMAFHSVEQDPQAGALQLMQDWFVQGQLPMGYLPRIFGYPKPLAERPGYEVLIELPPGGRRFTPATSMRNLAACAYACVTSTQPEWAFVQENIANGPYYVRFGDQWALTDAYGGMLQRQWMLEYHADKESLENCIRTGIVPPTYHHYTIMIPIARKG